MKKILMNYIKYFKGIQRIYRICGSIFLRIVGIFVPINKKLILFNSFGGKKYDDSPKVVFEYMSHDERFKEYEFVWAFHEPEKYHVENARIIKTDNLRYFITALSARCWVTNSAIERGLKFKKKHTLYVNTWHGTPIKLMGADEQGKEASKVPKRNYDIQTAQSKYEADVFSRVFNVDYENFIICGLPRNDALFKADDKQKTSYREKMGIPLNKKVILYAPTFREYARDKNLNCVLKPPIDFKHWKEVLGDEYIILIRAHYEVSRILNSDIDNDFVYDVSEYPVLNELIIASDMLISDYSSIMFDYSILNRPIFLYTYDYDEYSAQRGMYFDVRESLPGGSISEDELLQLIRNGNYDYLRLEEFRKKYVSEYGTATEQLVNKIYESLENKI